MASTLRRQRRSFPARRLPADSPTPTCGSDVVALLGELSDAIALVTVVHRSLAAHETAGTGDEEVALRHALRLLRATYSGLDRTTLRSRRQTPSPTP